METRRGLPLMTRLLLVVAVAALGITVFMTATGSLGRLVNGASATVNRMIDDLTATPTPRPTVLAVADSPLIVAPAEPYTNQAAVDLVMTLPTNVVGDADSKVRLYLALEGQQSVPIQEVGVGATTTLVIPNVALTAGRNDFTATVRGLAGESEKSPVVTYILDQQPPPIELAAPTDGQTINAPAATLTGRSQPRSKIIARNEANAASATAEAGADGAFQLALPLGIGANGIAITATDPAGNANQAVLGVVRGTGVLTAQLTAEPARIRVAQLPRDLELSVIVTDPDGRTLADAPITFTISVPGMQVITSDTVTAGDGTAVFRTTVPKGATAGQGVATVLVRTPAFGDATARTIINLVK